MLIKRIYRGNRGEGKTKWLAENAIDCVTMTKGDDSKLLFYLGSCSRYENFCNKYESITHSKCPIPRWEHDDMRGCDSAILFTDELMASINEIPCALPRDGIWFITMSAEDFVH
ncbi:MAG: hypothetical protein J6R47_04175 [Acholeplasmatales bacterium]|nr:hypothetical protein [Acholeplasmatales bacterium]